MAIDTLYSIVNYTGDGTTTSFTVPFPYLYVNDVHLSVDDEEVSVYPVISHDNPPAGYGAHWYSSNTIRFVTAPASDTKITIQRATNRAEPEVEFENSAILTEEDLNLIATQLIYIVQEAYDHFALSYDDALEIIQDATEDALSAKADAIDAKEDAIAAKESAEDASDAAQGYAEDAQEILDQVKLETIGKIDKVMARGEFSVVFENGDIESVKGTDNVEYNTEVTPTELKISLPHYYTVGAYELMLFRDYTLDSYPYKVSRFLKLDSVDDGYRHENYKEVGQVGEKANEIIILGPFQDDATYTYRYQILGISAASLVDDNTIHWDDENGISVDAEAVLGDVEDVIRENVEEDVAEILDDEYQKVNVKAWKATLEYEQGALVTGSDGALYVALTENGPSSTAINPVGDDTLTWKNLSTVNIIDIADFGAKGDGVTDDTAAIQAAADAAYETSSILYMSQKVNLISDDIEFKSEVMTHASVTIGTADWTEDQAPGATIYFARQTDIHDFVFRGVNVRIAPSSGTLSNIPTTITRNVFNNAYLIVGQDTSITNRYVIQGNTFWNIISRNYSGIKLVNVNNALISENNFNDHNIAIEISPTRSFAANGIEIVNNNINVFGTKGIWLHGTSMNRVSNVSIKNNIISSSNRVTTSSRFNACIAMGYVHHVIIEGNNLNSFSNVISFRGCSHVEIISNTLQQAKTYANMQFDCSRYVNIMKNLFRRFDQGYSILCSGNPNAFSGIYTECNWKGHDIKIEDNTFEVGKAARCIKYGSFINIHIKRNIFTSSVNFSDGCILNESSSGTDTGSILDNVFNAPGGTPIKWAPTSMITTLSGQTILTRTVPSISVTAPVVVNPDADLNNAKSYVFVFTLGEATQLKALNDGDNLKTMTEWIATLGTTPTLAWNSCANGDGQSDSIVNGVVNDFYGGDKYYRHTTGTIFIDSDGYVTCRDFTGTEIDTQRASIMLSEDAWQTALFRAPLVVDGAVYDVDTTGIYPKSDFQTRISGRTCLGQKADGTYVLLVVDGKTDSYGCTMEQAANKLLSLGCIQAFNLDGGGSTTLWYDGRIYNVPSDPDGERPIPTIMYI